MKIFLRRFDNERTKNVVSHPLASEPWTRRRCAFLIEDVRRYHGMLIGKRRTSPVRWGQRRGSSGELVARQTAFAKCGPFAVPVRAARGDAARFSPREVRDEAKTGVSGPRPPRSSSKPLPKQAQAHSLGELLESLDSFAETRRLTEGARMRRGRQPGGGREVLSWGRALSRKSHKRRSDGKVL